MRKSRSANHSHLTEDIQINLTPLIDVVFVVLIMFIIIAPMLELDRVQLADGAHQDSRQISTVQESSPITIHVHADDSIWYNNRLVSVKELLPLLKEAKKTTPNRIPQLFNDRNAHFGTYQNVKNAIELSGFEQLDVILQPN